jgi:uncharacterized protein (TIGR03083 family)
VAPSDPRLAALRSSVLRLRDLASTLTEAELVAPAYPTEWTVADVLSHIGSGATIMARRVDDELAGEPTPDDFAPSVWDTWNAKSPGAQRDDGLAADEGLLQRLETTPDERRATLQFAMGPLNLDFGSFVGMRLNEHAFHTWDIEVVGNPAAVLPGTVAECVVDNLSLIARFTAKPPGTTRVVVVRTDEPRRGFTLSLSPDAVAMEEDGGEGPPDLELSAEAFARLVYGRLDPDHTPASFTGDPGILDELRRTFPGP